jgi:hypothetical protein
MFRRILVSAIAIPVLGCSVSAAHKPAVEGGPVQVIYQDADKFTDIGDRYTGSAESQRVYLEELEQYIARRAAPFLKDKQRLTVTISDVDMAGAFEPWRLNLRHARIIRDVYPPRIDLSFTLTASDGTVLMSGERRLRDSTFMTSAPPYRSDPLRYEKKLLADWLDRELRQG